MSDSDPLIEVGDTGRNAKVVDQRDRKNNARIFDTLVASNVALVRTLKVSVYLMLGFGLIATIMTAFSAIILKQGQAETRALILSTFATQNCVTSATPAPVQPLPVQETK
ncbi:MAG: hypothetical protein M3Z05_18780 [Gemmatimonadota bacterium]|nr:hypothetical protein [Gemmatimonadota bacterium]